jgi:hypothetical protein
MQRVNGNSSTRPLDITLELGIAALYRNPPTLLSRPNISETIGALPMINFYVFANN